MCLICILLQMMMCKVTDSNCLLTLLYLVINPMVLRMTKTEVLVILCTIGLIVGGFG